MSRPKSMLIGAALATALIVPRAALADAHSEIVNAGMHAGLASGASDMGGVKSHLHHALNCLVGPGGAGFDAGQMNPCAQAGNGAIPDTMDAAKKKALEAAATRAREGIAASDLAAARKAAADTAAMLKKEE